MLRKGATYCDPIFEVEKMQWVDNHVEYTTKHFWYNSCHNTFTAEYLQPYKEQEETMEEDSILNQLIEYFKNTPRDVIEKEWHEYDKYNEIGPTVKEYLESINKPPTKEIRNAFYKNFKELIEKCKELL